MTLDVDIIISWVWFAFGLWLLLAKQELTAGLVCFVLSDLKGKSCDIQEQD